MLESIKIKLHSFTDLITNSSTVIYTYSDGCIEPLENMINEILTTFNIEEKCNDMFHITVLCNKFSYLESEEDEDEDEEDEEVSSNNKSSLCKDKESFDKLWEDIISGKAKKPDWFLKVEEKESYEGYQTSTYLHIFPKQEKYTEIAKLIKKFLYSTGHEATRDG
jgi:hypothetical protein